MVCSCSYRKCRFSTNFLLDIFLKYTMIIRKKRGKGGLGRIQFRPNTKVFISISLFKLF